MKDVISAVKEEKVIAIMRGIPVEQAVNTAAALLKGGIKFIEVTFNQSSKSCLVDTPAAIKAIGEAFEEVCVGAGTVITVEQVEAAHKAGAKYIISPNADEKVIKRTVELGMISMPGVFTPSEIITANSWGAHFAKIFPIGNLGADYVKAIRGPISHIPMLAVGGVDETNMQEFFKVGCCGFGIGGNLVNKKMIDNGDFDGITALAEKYVKIAQECK